MGGGGSSSKDRQTSADNAAREQAMVNYDKQRADKLKKYSRLNKLKDDILDKELKAEERVTDKRVDNILYSGGMMTEFERANAQRKKSYKKGYKPGKETVHYRDPKKVKNLLSKDESYWEEERKKARAKTPKLVNNGGLL